MWENGKSASPELLEVIGFAADHGIEQKYVEYLVSKGYFGSIRSSE
jgi:hypothetical protein